MKSKLFIALLLLIATKSLSQGSKLSIEVHYPIPTDQNFIGKNYNGIIDLGAKYRFAELTNFNFGASINSGVLKSNINIKRGFADIKVKSYLIQPRVFTEIKIESMPKFHPFAGLGYTLMIFRGSGSGQVYDNSGRDYVNVSDADENLNGINANFGISYDLTDKIFVDIQYDFIKIKNNKEITDATFNTNVNLLKIGFGVRF